MKPKEAAETQKPVQEEPEPELPLPRPCGSGVQQQRVRFKVHFSFIFVSLIYNMYNTRIFYSGCIA